MRQRAEHDKLEDYSHTEQTPPRREYSYPTAVPRTSDLDTVMELMRTGRAGDEPSSSSRLRSPRNTLICADNYGVFRQEMEKGSVAKPGSLRELDINRMNSTTTVSNITSMKDIALSGKDGTSSNALAPLPLLKRPAVISVSAESKVSPEKRRLRSTIVASIAVVADSENLIMPNLSASVGVAKDAEKR